MTQPHQHQAIRLLLAGHHELATEALSAILGAGFAATYVAESEPAAGRGEALGSVGDRFAVAAVEDDGDVPLQGAVRAYRPDVLLSCGYRRIIRKEVLDSVAYPVNVHFGALPRYRGCWSVPHAILHGDGEIGVTLHRMSPGIDDGPVYGQRMVADDGTRSCRDLYLEAVRSGVGLVLEFLGHLRSGAVPQPVTQDETRATYFGTRYPNDFRIDWRATALQVSRYIRASHFPPYPPAFTELEPSEPVHLHWPVATVFQQHTVPTGTVVALGGGGIGVAVLNGFIVPGLADIGGGECRPFPELATERALVGRRLGALQAAQANRQ